MVSNPLRDRTASNPCLNVTCDLDKTAARSLYLKHRVCLTHQLQSTPAELLHQSLTYDDGTRLRVSPSVA